MLTKAGAKLMLTQGGRGRPIECTIVGRYCTRVFEFPRALLQAETHVEPLQIIERERSKATVVSDLLSYFQTHSSFRHYSICCVLRSKVEKAVRQETSNAQKDRLSLFVVIEQETPCKITMDDGTCFAVDGDAIEGGRSGETVIRAVKTSDGAWPEEDDDNEFVNTVLAAAKVEQDTKESIRGLFNASCFFDENERAIYPLEGRGSGSLSVLSPVDEDGLRVKIGRLQDLINGFEADRQADRQMGRTVTARLIDALRLENTNDDHYRRTWYLRLFDAMEKRLKAKTTGRLGRKFNKSTVGHWQQNFDRSHADYRNTIAHPAAFDTMDMERFNDLQADVLAKLRCIYLDSAAFSEQHSVDK